MNPAMNCYRNIMGGPADGSGNVLAFSASSCYSSSGGSPGTPTTPTGLSVTGTTTSTASLSWSASSEQGGSGSISGYKIYRGGSQVGTTGNTTYTDTNLTASTTYTYTVAAYDSNGNTSSQSGSVQATTGSSDTTPPSVSISSPANGVTVSSTVTVQASASDNVGVTKVEFYLDGFLQTTDTTSPYTWSWNTASSTNGSHTLSAKAYDAAGNMGGSSNVSVTVSNPDTTPPTIPTGLGITGSTTSTISLSWTASTDNVGVTGYKVYRCTGACSPTTQIGTSTATSFTDTLLNQSTTYSYAVSAYDAAGNNSGKSSSAQGTTKFQDTTPPTVSIASPANNATVSSTVSLQATASDNVAVASVQFRIDGNLIGSPITASPYTYAWNSVSVGNGSHSMTALAKDTSGNQTISSAVTVTVSNTSSTDTTPPTIPTGVKVTGSTTSTISLSWNPSTDNVGVAGYKVYRNGTQAGTTGSTSFTDTGLAASTTYAYTVSAYDAAGNNSSQSSPTSGTTLPTSDVTPPSVAITNPMNGETVAGTITISGGSSDNVGVANVQISIDGGSYQTAQGTTSWTYNLDTTQLGNGNHTITAETLDLSGNTNSTAIVVNVNNQASSGGGGGGGGGGTGGGVGTGGGGSPTQPIDTSGLEALLQSLLKELEALISQLNAQLVATFTRNLTIGSSGADVKNLQVFLNDNGYTVASSGSGSPGNEGMIFGAKTAAALAKWQKANGITPASGILGPKTREYMKGKY